MNQNEYTFDLRIFYDGLRKRLAWLLILTVLVGVITGIITGLFVDKTYSSTVQFYVNSTGEKESEVISSTEISAAKSLVKTCTVIIESDSFLTMVKKQVKEDNGADLETSAIKKMLTQSDVSDTEILRVKVSHTDPDVAYAVAKAIEDLAPGKFSEIVEAGKLRPFDDPRTDNKADTPNIVRSVVIAMILAFFLLYAIFLIAQLADTTIRGEEDIKKLCSYPFLGEVPRISTESDGKSKSASKEA